MRRQHFAQAWQLLFTPGAIVPFVVATLALTVIGSATYDLLLGWFGENPFDLLRLILLALLVLVVTVVVLVRFVGRIRVTPPGSSVRQPEKRKGLIVLVSREETGRSAIDYHIGTLERCWLVCSTAGQSSSAAVNLQSHCEGKNVAASVVPVKDAFDAMEIRDRVHEIFATLPDGWTDTDIIADFTGMTAPASVGMVLACLSPSRALQYVTAQYDAKLNPQIPGPLVEIDLTWKAVINDHGRKHVEAASWESSAR